MRLENVKKSHKGFLYGRRPVNYSRLQDNKFLYCYINPLIRSTECWKIKGDTRP